MSQTLSVTEVARHFAEYINRVAYRGECFVLMRGNKPIAELRPLPVGKRLAELPAVLASLPISRRWRPHSSPPTSRPHGKHLPMRRSTIHGGLD
jgi:antitoxin (DNA-binding transcriptional repressor) of toxin-antitoxin stability system